MQLACKRERGRETYTHRRQRSRCCRSKKKKKRLWKNRLPQNHSLLSLAFLTFLFPALQKRTKPLLNMASLAAFKPVALRSVRASRASAVVPVAAFPSKYVPAKRARGERSR